MKKIITILFILAVFPLNLYSQWTQITSPTSSSLYTVFFTDTNTGYLSGSLNGIVIKTTNGGASWIFLSTGTASTFYDMYFTDQQTGIIGGTSKQILKTTNAGVNWDIKTSGSGTIYSLAYSPNTYYAVGGSPTVIDKSNDGGSNWVSVTPPTSYPLKGDWFSTANLGWVCGYNGTIWKTTDGGFSWIPQSQSSSYNFEKIQFFGLNYGYIVGANGTLLRTSNSGTNWNSLYSGVSGTLYDILLYNSTTGWIIGSNGTVLKTTDGGTHWYQQTTTINNTLNSICMVNANTGYIVGSGGVLLKTTNGGGSVIVPTFEKITSGPLISDQSYGSGCAWGDYDHDGNLDLIVTSYNDYGNSDLPFLYKNLGNENFQRITNSVIVTNSLQQTLACVWGDYNHDCLLDLFISTGYNQPELLYKNIGGGNFQRITEGDLVNTPGHSGSACWTDYNRDGYLDVLVVRHGTSLLFKGNPNDTFTKITSGPIVTDYGTHRRAMWADFNNDRYPDLYVTNYNDQNDNLYLNNKNGTFTKITTGAIVNSGGWGSGCTWGDYNNDGWMDLYVTNDGGPNFLFKNNKNGTFTKITSGSIVNDGGGSFGCNWGDIDNDGDLDLFVANNYRQFNCLYKNEGNDNFTKITNDPVVSELSSSVGSTLGDYNKDGKLDLFVVNQGYYSYPAENDFLYKNTGALPYYLIVKLYGGIGTRVRLRIGNHILIREVSGGNGCSSQDMPWLHFGLGFMANDNSNVIDSVIVYWNDGYQEFATNVPINQIIEFHGIVGISNISNQAPREFRLKQNYPNPFNPLTTIEYTLPRNSSMKLTIFDLNGKVVQSISDNNKPAGVYRFIFHAKGISSGVYFYKLETPTFTDTKKMILVK